MHLRISVSLALWRARIKKKTPYFFKEPLDQILIVLLFFLSVGSIHV